ncbi:MAG: hypothetical protein ABH816_03535 [Candidatus Levyibacteriota bacterium]
MSKTILSFVFLVVFLALIMPEASYAKDEYDQKIIKVISSSTTLKTEDSRTNLLRHFLNNYNSPLAANADTFVEEADKNNLDWRFVAAISGVESTFGLEIPYKSYNAWGWGIYGDNMIRFNSYDEGIKVISKSLREKYINAWGAQDIHQIGRFYAASPTWSQRVVYLMEKVDEFAINNPKNYLSLSL